MWCDVLMAFSNAIVSQNTANQSVGERLQRVLLISSALDMINSS